MAHATRYNDASHEHNGVACDVTLVIAEDVIILPAPPPVPSLPIYADTVAHISFTSANYVSPQGRGPPPRSPPTLF
ncbi:MAG: hypothetical protein ABJG88_11010 [Litorimonas sp.]